MAAITVTTQPPVDPQTPSPSYYVTLVIEFMEVFDRLTEILPKLEAAEAASAQAVRRNLSVPDNFCLMVVNAVEQTPELDAARKLDPVLARNHLEFLDAFRPLDVKVAEFSRRLTHALRAVKSQVATASLQIYRIAQGLASDGTSPGLRALVDAMKRELKRKGLSKAERDERKAAKLKEEVEMLVAQRLKEVMKAAA